MKAIIFDLDGTLTINQSQILDNHKYALGKINPSLTSEQISSYLGKSIQSIALALGLDEDAIRLFQKYYNESDQVTVKQTRLVPNIIDLLTRIQSKSIPMAIVTSKIRETTFRLLEHLGISQFFKAVITSEDVLSQKPDPEGINLACGRLGVHPDSNVYFVGDTISDIQASLAAGLTPIAVLWGVAGSSLVESFERNIEIVKSVNEIIAKIL